MNTFKAAILFSLIFLSTAFARADVTSTKIEGDVAKPAAYTTAELLKGTIAPAQTIHYTSKDGPHALTCVSLLALIDASQPKFNSHIKNHQLQFIIAVQGFDGYTVDFSYPELEANFGNRAAWLALDIDGKPLTGEAGPMDLIVPDDVKAGRWVKGVAAIIVIDTSTIPTPPTKP